MTPKQRRHLHGGPSVKVEPHRISQAKWERGSIWCADCGGELVYGRDGQYRHRVPC